MKSIKFNPELTPLVLSGEKTSTWRMFDDKDLQEGDELALVNRGDGEVFAHATITKIREKKLGEVEEVDFKTHGYANRDEMLQAFRGYYGESVTSDTPVKLIDFVLI